MAKKDKFQEKEIKNPLSKELQDLKPMPEKFQKFKKYKKLSKKLDPAIHLETRKLPTKTTFHFSNLEWQARRKYSDYEMYGRICIYAIRNDGTIVDRYNFITLYESDYVDLVEEPNRKIKFPHQAKVTLPTSREDEVKIYIVFGINEEDNDVDIDVFTEYVGVPDYVECNDDRYPMYNGGSDDFYVINKDKTLNTNGGWFSVRSKKKVHQEIYFDATVAIEGQKMIYVSFHHDDDRDYQVEIQFSVSKEVKSRLYN